MLVNVAPNGQKVALSIPRDTYAEIPGVGWDKINASYAYGGPAAARGNRREADGD